MRADSSHFCNTSICVLSLLLYVLYKLQTLRDYSPVHNVSPDAGRYPATLLTTGDHDDRVVPAHSFKFAAALQEKNESQNPMLIRIDVNAGHGAGKPTAKQIDEFGDMWSFVFYHLKMEL